MKLFLLFLTLPTFVSLVGWYLDNPARPRALAFREEAMALFEALVESS